VIGKKDDAANQQWMDDVLAAFGEIEQKAAALNNQFNQLSAATAEYGGKAPQALQPMIESLLQSNKLTGDQRSLLEGMVGEPGWEVMEAKAKQYGISLEALGPQFQQSKLNELAVQYAADFDFLIENGADMNGVLRDMADEAQGVVDTALQFGTTVPENMRPMLQSLVDMGLLTDANGDALEDLSQFEFGPKLESPFDRIATILEDIFVLLGGELPIAAETGAEGIRAALGDLKFTIPIDFDVNDPDWPENTIGTPGRRGEGGEGPEIPGFQGGTHGLRDFGGGTLVRLHGREDVRTESQYLRDYRLLTGTSSTDLGAVSDRAAGDAFSITIHTTHPIDQKYMRGPFRHELAVALREDPNFRRDVNRGLTGG
jgi:hypothetical protein